MIQLPVAKPATATAATFSFEAQADAYVDARQPSQSFGDGRTLRVKGKPRRRS